VGGGGEGGPLRGAAGQGGGKRASEERGALGQLINRGVLGLSALRG
jgi:hypothetical protein